MKEVRIDFVAPLVAAYAVGSFTSSRIVEALRAMDTITSYQREELELTAQYGSFFVGLAVFLVFRYLMLASGLFPPLFFPLRFLPSWKKYILYYGVLYYDENVDKICALYNKGKIAEAAYEFSTLAGIDLQEAQQAMGFWKRIYGEGILPKGRRKQ